MSEAVLSVRDLGKRYRIGAAAAGEPASLFQGARRLALSPFRYLLDSLRAPGEAEVLWALRGVSFEVGRGEVLGVIGRNGSGKSTLLKLLSRITAPTEGEADIDGRVASLLEVGTGFHPELTGRENVYLNGAIHGMRRAEIDRKLDAIVDFSEVGRMVDTPVKRYSSGMRVRLGFSVAAHLDPEVLVVDEVLSVGDEAFRSKCIAKMLDLVRGGRTILFVSHNMEQVITLCGRVLWLDRGRVRALGSTAEVIAEYLGSCHAAASVPLAERADRRGPGPLRLTSMRLLDLEGNPREVVELGQGVALELAWRGAVPALRSIHVALVLKDELQRDLLRLSSRHARGELETVPEVGRLTVRVPRFPLAPGRYTAQVAVFGEDGILDGVDDAMVLEVVLPTGWTGRRKDLGAVLCEQAWELGT